jgi:tripartite-type tricarboxylate transporter receptor subunit TctC
MIRRFCLSLLLLGAACAFAQTYPSKPVRWILPALAGGANDTAARLIAPRLGELLGQTVVVDNRGGAGGNIAMEVASKSQADGYTIAQVSTIQAMNRSFYRKLSYDLVRDLAPVIELISVATVMVVHPSVPVYTPQELIAYARANPGKLNFASGTNGATGHYLKYLAGIDMEVVLYRGTPPAVTETVAGQSHVMVGTSSDLMPFARAGKLRAIALTSSTRRSPLYPDLPPLADAVPGFESPIWYGVAVPARTPAAIVRRLHAGFSQVLQNADIRQRLAGIGYEVSAGSSEQFGERIRNEVSKWPKVVEAMGGPVN